MRALPISVDAESLASQSVTWCEAWRGYLAAAERYSGPGVAIADLTAHNDMLLELGGHLFCMFPGVDWSIRRSIAHFGALDRFFSDLLALERGAGRLLPCEVLARFGLSSRDFADERCRSRPGYRAFLSFWLDRYLPTLKHEAAEFSHMTGLPDELVVLRAACLRRHAQIEQAIRSTACATQPERSRHHTARSRAQALQL